VVVVVVVVWCGVVWCGVVCWCGGVVWCGVVWCAGVVARLSCLVLFCLDLSRRIAIVDCKTNANRSENMLKQIVKRIETRRGVTLPPLPETESV